nr:DNA-directed RNA polymerase subunit [Cedratvirus borely]WIL03746.1 DNA-directed RNA polymerase subunit [Cedratvirus plubellavi]
MSSGSYPMRTIHDLPPELVNMVYSYCPRDLTNAPPNVVQRCTEEGVYREALGGRRVYPGFTAKETYEIYSAGGKFIPLYYNGSSYYIPIFRRTTIPQLVDEISNTVRENKRIELSVSNQRIVLGSVHPNLILTRGPMNVTSPLFARKTKFTRVPTKEPNVNIYDSDSVHLYAL